MAEPSPDRLARAHMRWLALSRWDNEGGASQSRPTDGSADTAPHQAIRSTPGGVLLLLALEASAPSTPTDSRQIDATVPATSAWRRL